MLKHITIKGLGPTTEGGHNLSMGVNNIVGPSESGKTTIMRAVFFALHGTDINGKTFPVEAISDDCDELDVELELVSGMLIQRVLAKDRTGSRWVTSKGEQRLYTRESDMQAALGLLGQNHDLLRLVMVPFAWEPMCEANARKMRDTIALAMPTYEIKDVVKKLMGEFQLKRGDPMDEAAALEIRKRANKKRDESVGAVSATDKAYNDVKAKVLDFSGDGDAIANQTTKVETLKSEWEAAAKAFQDHSDAVVTQPHKSVSMQISNIEQRYKIAKQKKADAPKNTNCTTCGRRGWEGAAKAKEEAKEMYDKAKEEQKQLPDLKAKHKDLLNKWGAQNKRLHIDRDQAKQRWEDGVKELGAMTAEVGFTKEQVAEAAQRVTDAKDACNKATKEATRLDALVKAVREAPSYIAKHNAEKLGDMGPVELKFNTGKGPAVEVYIDGRPHWLASTGRRIYADLYLRKSIRAAMGAPWLPLFVEQAQDWSGELPDCPPMYVLRTQAGEGLEVSNGA